MEYQFQFSSLHYSVLKYLFTFLFEHALDLMREVWEGGRPDRFSTQNSRFSETVTTSSMISGCE